MKQLLMALLFPVALSAQKKDVVKLTHTNYTTYFSKSKKYPVRVEWWVTKARISCVKGTPRTDKFIPDPLLQDDTNLQKDYTASGFDRGHLAPAADFKCGHYHSRPHFGGRIGRQVRPALGLFRVISHFRRFLFWLCPCR